jgi:hypothetical protein
VLVTLLAVVGTLGGCTASGVRTDLPNSALLSKNQVETGYGQKVIAVTALQRLNPGPTGSGPGQLCSESDLPGYLHLAWERFHNSAGVPIGYEKVWVYRSSTAAIQAVNLIQTYFSSCPNRMTVPNYADVAVRPIAAVGLGRHDSADVISQVFTDPRTLVSTTLEYVAEVEVANVFAEIVLSGNNVAGDPGVGSLLATAANGRIDLGKSYGDR